MKEPILQCQNVCFSYHNLTGETSALTNISFQINKGEFVSVVGPSGCGKSTLLSLIAGLNKPESGSIFLTNPENTKIGYMLQQDHLLEWRTIYKNIMLGPEISKTINPESEKQALTLLNDYGLSRFQDKKPGELSGGMKQRAALIRTMMLSPKLLLLDEPFSALDYQTRLMVSADIGRIIRSAGITTVLVTHDLSEAIALSDRILILSKRPATIKKEIAVSLTLPDDSLLAARNAPEFQYYFSILWKEISDEYGTDSF